GGQALDAVISARLLESIFWPNSPLHDLGVVVRGNRIVAAGVQFPLAEEGVLPPRSGSRHRAAAGLTMESDCVVVIVSEETGAISIAANGKIEYNLPRDRLEEILAEKLQAPPVKPAEAESQRPAASPEPQQQQPLSESRRINQQDA